MICHQHKCVFVHIPKTAGESITDVFVRSRGLSYEKSYARSASWIYCSALLCNPNPNLALGPPTLAHARAEEYLSLELLTPDQFDMYFKFSVVRNPWDRLVSIYTYSGYAKDLPFKKYLFGPFLTKEWIDRYWFVGPQYEFLCDDQQNVLVDFIGKFEDIQSDFARICRSVGLPEVTPLPHTNKSSVLKKKTLSSLRRAVSNSGILPTINASIDAIKKNRNTFRTYPEYYDNESIQLVRDLYKKDIEMFNYEFGK